MSKEYSKGREVIMFSDARIAFEREVRENHPKLAMKIIVAFKEAGDSTDQVYQGIAVGTVAAEFNIGMEGLYSYEQIEYLYESLYNKLRGSIAPIADIILPPGSTMQ